MSVTHNKTYDLDCCQTFAQIMYRVKLTCLFFSRGVLVFSGLEHQSIYTVFNHEDTKQMSIWPVVIVMFNILFNRNNFISVLRPVP